MYNYYPLEGKNLQVIDLVSYILGYNYTTNIWCQHIVVEHANMHICWKCIEPTYSCWDSCKILSIYWTNTSKYIERSYFKKYINVMWKVHYKQVNFCIGLAICFFKWFMYITNVYYCYVGFMYF